MDIEDKNWNAWATELVERLQNHGATDAECHISVGVAREVSIRDGEIEKAETASGRRVALRAYVGQKTASTSFSLDVNADLDETLDSLLVATNASPEDPYTGLADPNEWTEAQELDLQKFDTTQVLSIDALKSRAQVMESSVQSGLRVDQAGAQHGHYREVYVASNGHQFDEWASYCAQSIVAIHQGAQLVRDYASHGAVYLSDLESPEKTGARASERTWAAQNPIRPNSGHFPVMFDERVSNSLFGHVLGAMSAGAIARRASWLIDYEDAILPDGFVLRETPHRVRRLSSALRDGEGYATRENDVIRDGRPQFWTSNLSTSRQLGEKTSGHARRSGVSTGASITATHLDAPSIAREKMLHDMGEGLLVTGFIGATINPHTGDYSRGVNGFWVRNGEIAEPVNEATIAGNLKSMLPTMRAADDANHDRSSVIPSLLIEEMTIAGE